MKYLSALIALALLTACVSQAEARIFGNAVVSKTVVVQRNVRQRQVVVQQVVAQPVFAQAIVAQPIYQQQIIAQPVQAFSYGVAQPVVVQQQNVGHCQQFFRAH